MKTSEEIKQPFLSVLIDNLSEINEPCELHKVTYSLNEILFLVYYCSVCQMNSYEEIQDFVEDRIDWLRKQLPYQEGIPNRNTINRVMGLLKSSELERMLVELSNYLICLPDGKVVNIDRKWLGSSAIIKKQQTRKSAGGKQAIIMVNAYSAAHRSCLASIQVGNKPVEKHATSGVLELLNLLACLLTMDVGYYY